MPNRLAFAGAVFAAIAALLGPQRASAEGNLVVYCAVQEEWCRNMVAAFERQTGIKVAMTRKSSGEFYAQVQAEASNPRGDIQSQPIQSSGGQTDAGVVRTGRETE